MMKILVIGHTYLRKSTQEKWVEMKGINNQLDILILTPKYFSHLLAKKYNLEKSSGLEKHEIRSIQSFFNRSHMTFFFNPFEFVYVLIKFRPNIIHIEADPYSAIGAETFFLSKLFYNKAPISFFIWDNLNRKPKNIVGLLKKILNDIILSSTSLVICGNSDAYKLLRVEKNYKNLACVLPQIGLNENNYKPNFQYKNNKNNKNSIITIGFIGRLIEEKGLLILFEALSKLQRTNWKFIVLGAGPLEDKMKIEWAPKFGSKFHFFGSVEPEKVINYLKRIDVLVLPSLTTYSWKEQFGLVLAEAMLCGIPCIGSNSGAIPEVLGPGGLIVREGNVDDLKDALQLLLSSPSLRAELSNKALYFARERYSSKRVAEKYFEYFSAITNNEYRS